MARRRIRRKRPIRDAMAALESAGNQAAATAQLTRAVLREMTDGIHIKLIRSSKGSLWDFATGKIDELPIEVRIDLLEPGDRL